MRVIQFFYRRVSSVCLVGSFFEYEKQEILFLFLVVLKSIVGGNRKDGEPMIL